jgi:1-acyl-sn-glycerol-3-phosphate acyltransferase
MTKILAHTTHPVSILAGVLLVTVLLAMVASLIYRRRDRGDYRLRVAFWKMTFAIVCNVWYRLRRIGNQTIPDTGALIIAANHGCAIDPLLLQAVCPRRYISFIIAAEFARKPWFKPLIEMVECIPVQRDGLDATAARSAMRHLRDGKVLGIFPEGRIVRPDEPPVEPKEGVAVLALRTGATVIPVHITGTRFSESVVTPILMRHRARVTVGPPVDLSPYLDNSRDRDNITAAAEAIMRAIRALGQVEA